MTIREGGCLCGAVRFEVRGEPIVAGACYCRDCQYVSGGAAAYGMMFPADALTVKQGEMKAFTLKSDSGVDVYRHFCPQCGVHLISHNGAHPQFRAIKAGVLDDPSCFESEGSIWTSSAQPWHRIDPDLPSREKNPDIDPGTAN
ncbi:GFA family protein [Pelagibius sp. Alg239-R121]|uniref:GFA family protein n=1 Tax=Pelagibius sp. Alg239-R121 TaxID=2993448 RepID=UPI0024A681F6|nr:GFA family protein [Pelagibius sp. Alg239-R121]